MKTNNLGKQTKIGDYYNHTHTQKDDKDMWCKEKGYSIENIAGDGNCLFACLGKSRKLSGDKVRTIINENAEREWNVMDHDPNGQEIKDFKERTMDKKEWGQYDHIVIWSRIYHLKIEIHSYNMATQIVDGDEFMVEKEVIRLLYCNQQKWGDSANHYDLMHPIPQITGNSKVYSRRTNEEQ